MESAQKQPDARLNKKQIAIIVQNALRELPEEQRIVIIMKEYQGLKFKEIAAALNEPLSTIASEKKSVCFIIRFISRLKGCLYSLSAFI